MSRFVITDELFWLLSDQPEVVFTCHPCRQIRSQDSSLKEELQSKLIIGLEEVLINLLSSDTTQHLLACNEVRANQTFYLNSNMQYNWCN